MGWFGGNSTGSAIPTPHGLLRSVSGGRVRVAAPLYVSPALRPTFALGLDILVTSFVLVAPVVVTIASYGHTHIGGGWGGGGQGGKGGQGGQGRRSPGRTFLYS